jgi:hypothetical protein
VRSSLPRLTQALCLRCAVAGRPRSPDEPPAIIRALPDRFAGGGCSYVKEKLVYGVLQWIVMASGVASGVGWRRCQTRRAR